MKYIEFRALQGASYLTRQKDWVLSGSTLAGIIVMKFMGQLYIECMILELGLTIAKIKVVNMGTAISETKLMDKWAASKRTQVSAILCIKLLPLLENALKLNFKALYETENLDPLQGPTHTLTSSSIHTQNRPKNYGWIYHLLSSLPGYSPKLTATLKNRGLATLGFQKNSTHTN